MDTWRDWTLTATLKDLNMTFLKCLRLPAPPARLTSPILPPAAAKVSHTGQHSPAGVVTFSQSGSSLHWTSSHSETPFWQAQTRQGSGLQISSCWYVLPSTAQPSPFLASMTESGHRGGEHEHVTMATGSGLLPALLGADCDDESSIYGP